MVYREQLLWGNDNLIDNYSLNSVTKYLLQLKLLFELATFCVPHTTLQQAGYYSENSVSSMKVHLHLRKEINYSIQLLFAF